MIKKAFSSFQSIVIFVLIGLFITSFFTTSVQSAAFSIEENQTTFTIYLPLLLKNFPTIPEPPTLDTINNPDGDGNYTISWNEKDGTAMYLLQEDDTPDFSSPVTVYLGSNKSQTILNKSIGTYYYRVNASNSYANSAWSNIQQVYVNIPTASCPQEVTWFGFTSQDESIEFYINNSPNCQIQNNTLSINFTDGCGSEQTSVFADPASIINSHFEMSNDLMLLSGDFTSINSASGTFIYTDPTCSTSGVWTASANYGANGKVYQISVDSNDKLLVSGMFSTLGGAYHDQIGRLNTDNTLDSTFVAEADSHASDFLVLNDQKILVGGEFKKINNENYPYLVRLNPDGTIDPSFNADLNSRVYSIALQNDQKILIGGNFDTIESEIHEFIARLNSDGSVDSTFNPCTNGTVGSVAVQTDGKIIIGGYFSSVNDDYRNNIARLNSDGSVDTSFNTSANYLVDTILLQEDNKILIAGNFTTINGEARNHIARLNPDGTLDSTFNLNLNGGVSSIKLSADNKILIAGSFTMVKGETRLRIAKLNLDGSLDTTFNPGANNNIIDMAVQSDGTIFVGGNFTALGGETRYFLGQINPDGSIYEP